MPATAFIALLPFDLLTRADTRVAPHRISIGGKEVVLYWPFWHEPAPARQLPPIRSAAIPSRSSVPFFQVPPFELHIELSPPSGHSFANALRIDSLETTDEEFITALAADLLRQCRVRTNQWWIGHAHREGEGLVRAAYNIDEQGFLVGQECRAGAVIEPRLGIERTLTPVEFSAACASLSGGGVVPPHWDLFYDAVYFSIHQRDWRRALLDACIACDMAVTHEAIRAGGVSGKPEPVVRHALSDRDLLINLRRGLPNLFGSAGDYSLTNPADFELIRRLWAARGSIAHGHVPTTGSYGRGFMPTAAEAADLILAAMRLLGWLTGLPHATPSSAVSYEASSVKSPRRS